MVYPIVRVAFQCVDAQSGKEGDAGTGVMVDEMDDAPGAHIPQAGNASAEYLCWYTDMCWYSGSWKVLSARVWER